MSYFALLQHAAGHAVVMDATTDAIKVYESVLAAEQDAGALALVFNFANFETPVSLVPAGTPMLVNGQWVVSK